MPVCVIQVLDEVNVRLQGLDERTLKTCVDALTFTVKNSHYMEKVRAGRWDGKIGLLKQTGLTYRHLLDKILWLLVQLCLVSLPRSSMRGQHPQ